MQRSKSQLSLNASSDAVLVEILKLHSSQSVATQFPVEVWSFHSKLTFLIVPQYYTTSYLYTI